MKSLEKTAVVRVLVDLIKADRIIDTGEMMFYEVMRRKYGFSQEHEVAALSMSFSEAIAVLRCSDRAIRTTMVALFATSTMALAQSYNCGNSRRNTTTRTTTLGSYSTNPSSESRTYDNAYDSHSTATATKTDNPYLKNEFQTGSISDADILLTRKINSLLFIQKCNVCLFCKYLI